MKAMSEGEQHGDALWDIEEIKQLKARFFRLMDQRKWDEFRTVFTEDARLETDSTDERLTGPEEIVAYVRHACEGALSTVHVPHQPEIRLMSTQTATATWTTYGLFEYPTTALRSGIHGYGRMEDEYRKVDGEWRISAIRNSHRWEGEVYFPASAEPLALIGERSEGQPAGTTAAADNRRSALLLIDRLAAADADGFLAVTAPNATWWSPTSGSVPIETHFDHSRAAASKVQDANFSVVVTGVTAEGDRVAVEAEVDAPLQDGRRYHQQYHFLFVFEDGLVKQVKEYQDTKLAAEMFSDV